MPGLALRIGPPHCRTRQPVTQVQLMKQPLTLTRAQLNLIAGLQALRQGFAIPQIGLQSGLVRGLAQQAAHFLQLVSGQATRPSAMIAFGQAGQTVAIGIAK